ncbi:MULTISPECIES: hypothetical protein [unclassified Flavobacterium]|uniref:hypothetical protein n=1 Tax=unclassified Flavobacterium TaxID=196869 RepID=UPI000F0CC2C3|nr:MULTISPECIES: hypothetical protein [unclassified Flavobacterium]AYN03370.1 hypothetical protein EAG11_03675 [Flavobacterium sp. 140616W15]MCD0476051.1 hypothetical protein [Flavobacterium sp. EDS]
MSLKQSEKLRLDDTQVQYGGWDDDGYRKILYNETFYTGYLVLDRNLNGSVAFEKEYKNGSHLGWDNEYNQNEQLIRTTLTVGETSLAFYEYDLNGNQIGGGKLTDDGYYQKMVSKYKLD